MATRLVHPVPHRAASPAPSDDPSRWSVDVVTPSGFRVERSLAPGESVVIGRAPDDARALVVPDDTVSARHLRVRVTDAGAAVITPCPSTNGLFADGAALTRESEPLREGVLLEAGHTFVVVSRRHSVVHGLVCHSHRTRQIAHDAMKCAGAPPELPVLIDGETGSGKSALVHLMHRASRRGTAPLVEALLTEEPPDMVAPAIFGCVAGYASGASAREGAITAAGAGTLFLDEVGELSPTDQTRLLRPLRARRFHVLGETADREVRCRFVFATNRDLARDVAQGRFREDLLHRIRGLSLRMPPLRERREDIPLLIEHFHAKLSATSALPGDLDTPVVQAEFAARRWEGNLGELHHVVLLACALGSFRAALGLVERDADVPTEQPPSGLPDLDPRALDDLRALDEVKAAVERYYLTRALEIAARTNADAVAQRLGYKTFDNLRKRVDTLKKMSA